MTNTRINVARSLFTPFTPIFAKIEVRAANIADKTANKSQFIVYFKSTLEVMGESRTGWLDEGCGDLDTQ